MHLKDQNYREIITSYNSKDWQPLLELIPEIENTSEFGKLSEAVKDKDGNLNFPYWITKRVVDKFHETVYQIPIVINFAWPSWDAGREILQNKDFDFNSIDIPEKCKLITAIVRNDRFKEGALIAAFEEGIILKILKSIKKQLGEE